MYYPLMLDIREKNIIVVGGGKVAYRKALKLLEFSGRVTIVSPGVIEEFNKLKIDFKDKLNIIKSKYNKKYINGAFLVIGATSDKNINEIISCDCREKNILCNIVDNINKSDFIVPSSINRGSLVISVSTMGKSPILTSKIRKELEDMYSYEYEEYVELLGRGREVILKKYENKKEMLNLLINMNIEELKNFLINNE